MVLVLRVSSGREGLWVTEVWTLLPAGAFMRPQPGLPPLASGQERRESSVDSWMGETEAGGDKPWATGEDQWSQPGSLAHEVFQQPLPASSWQETVFIDKGGPAPDDFSFSIL